MVRGCGSSGKGRAGTPRGGFGRAAWWQVSLTLAWLGVMWSAGRSKLGCPLDHQPEGVVRAGFSDPLPTPMEAAANRPRSLMGVLSIWGKAIVG